ncbi:phosphoadenosine phosphosulfate reductase [Micromonospora sp. WMMA1363]|uniref:phosphoadenosine phosphosulfate reductase n=1 Tax=Micromonospora sp. WMMA1363 TaxID=3053985 RepID=UPI00259CD367|nr:phosphoadenosine phosphosulfate reductase [Micromonospora sp. WMMA1363]MDM4721833.1 phosphoadenosine phosphosulfate reductase [Micromonospora sp. WMMA1363]
MLRTFSFGGGVQSTAALVLAAEGVIDFPVFLFANVGDDSEDPATLAYIERYAKPYAESHGIQLHELRRVRQRGPRAGEVETLYGRLTRPGSRSLSIPVRMSNGAPGTRACTADFKIRIIGRWLKAHGASASNPATVGVGISLDEIHRVNNRRSEPYEQTVYPLLDHAPPLRRHDCARIITAAGLPVPPKSACWFCPLHRPATWGEMRRDRPGLFARACHLESLLNERRDVLGKDPVYLTRFNAPLGRAVGEAGPMLPGFGNDVEDALCDNGSCFT